MLKRLLVLAAAVAGLALAAPGVAHAALAQRTCDPATTDTFGGPFFAGFFSDPAQNYLLEKWEFNCRGTGPAGDYYAYSVLQERDPGGNWYDLSSYPGGDQCGNYVVGNEWYTHNCLGIHRWAPFNSGSFTVVPYGSATNYHSYLEDQSRTDPFPGQEYLYGEVPGFCDPNHTNPLHGSGTKYRFRVDVHDAFGSPAGLIFYSFTSQVYTCP